MAGMLPRPSESPLDPLNWPKWKKDLAFSSLCLSTAVVAVLKNIFVTSNAVIATQCNVTYTAAAALTGLPFIISACAGLICIIVAERFGKRPIYLVSSFMMLGGTVWNMNALQNYSQFMLSRVVQGLGWAVFDSLLLASISDMFFTHQRPARNRIYNIIVLLFSLGSPALVGSISQSAGGIHRVLMVISIIQAVSVILLILCTPETHFDRSLKRDSIEKRPGLSTTISASAPPRSKFGSFFHSFRPMPYKNQSKTVSYIAPIRSMAAPSVLLTVFLTASFVAGTQGLIFSLSLIFSGSPVFLFPERIGYLFILPVAFSIVSYASSCLIARIRNSSPRTVTIINPIHSLGGTIPGTVISMAGLLSFGIYTAVKLSSNKYTISLRVISLLVGILVSGTTSMTYYATKYLDAICTPHSSSQPSTSLYTEPNFTTSYTTLQTFLAGMFIIAVPTWISPKEDMATGLKITVIAVTVSQIVVGSSILALLWTRGEVVRRLDERILNWGESKRQRVEDEWELAKWKTNNSYMDV
ncbi:major facilitator superfamily domain-containing protein [Xylogone sp. PMI_703]|nr:major facilitator superfamily domain-containing protein [Xylogone sp. PMI_703]